VRQLVTRSRESGGRRFIEGSLAFCILAILQIAESAAQELPNVVLNEVSIEIERGDLPTLLDEDGTPQGFVELFNSGEAPQALAGWSIRADDGSLGSWFLPAIELEPGELLRVWTSGKDRSVAGSPLHTNFVLGDTSFVSLVDTQEAVVDEAPLAIPVDLSFGRCGDAWYYFDQPTPGELNRAAWVAPIVVTDLPSSLSVGRPHHFVTLPVEDEIWSSDDPRLLVLPDGEIEALVDVVAPSSAPVFEVHSPSLNATKVFSPTVVNWTANVSALEELDVPVADQILGADELGVYFSQGSDLYRSGDGMQSSEWIGPLPTLLASDAQLRATPFGFILRSGSSIYHSLDLASWSLEFAAAVGGLRSNFDTYWDPAAALGKVILSEYSTATDSRHAVYVGSFQPNGESTWQTVFVFSSIEEGEADPMLLDVARHVHVSAIDPYTGDLWVGTGDTSLQSRILTARSGTNNLEVLGLGSQEWRSLAIWFSPTHIYWNMDTTESQSVWRIPRTMRDPLSGWVSITPELASGTTQPGIRYLVTADAPNPRLPVAVGETWVETTPRPLDSDHRVRPLDDPAFDYREHVAELDNGSHWFQLWVEDDQGEAVSIMAASAEGHLRDGLGRVFGLKERPDGSVDVQELIAVEPAPFASPYVQLEPLTQDPLGFVYFEGRMTGQGLYKTRLHWNDDDGSNTGGPTPAEQAVVPPSPAHCLVPIPEPSASTALGAALPLLAALAGGRALQARARHGGLRRGMAVR
jgi:hypothetical protein